MSRHPRQRPRAVLAGHSDQNLTAGVFRPEVDLPRVRRCCLAGRPRHLSIFGGPWRERATAGKGFSARLITLQLFAAPCYRRLTPLVCFVGLRCFLTSPEWCRTACLYAIGIFPTVSNRANSPFLPPLHTARRSRWQRRKSPRVEPLHL